MDNASSLGNNPTIRRRRRHFDLSLLHQCEKKGKRSSLRRDVGRGLRDGVAVNGVRKRDFYIEPAGDGIACALVDDGVE
ncbi:hypothetical protein KC356_g247 [Hortaea werneckii]|nr:hypothetical protein KC356_g247 [Hortaea werneckii]